MRTTRRSVLGASAASLALSLTRGSLGGTWPLDSGGGIAATPSGGAVPSHDERRALVRVAHFGRKQAARGRDGMAICTHPLASNEAVQVLRAGGNAADAALAASLTQTVVEPHMTTITGCLCFLYYDATTGEISYCNGNVDHPRAEIPGFNAGDLEGGRGVAVPGFWAGFQAAHERFGLLPRPRVMDGAIRYARDGFETHPFLWGEIFVMAHRIGLTEAGREIYMPANAIPRPGEVLYQRRAADTLEALASEGNEYFYRGAFAEELVDTVRAAGGVLTMEDMEAYEARWMEPARSTYRGYETVGSPPPDNGGTHIVEMLNMIELLDLGRLGPPTENPETLYQLARIVDLVFTEGAKQRDPRSFPMPLERIVSKDYARMRFEMLQMGNSKSADEVTPSAVAGGGAIAVPPPGSNHVTVADAAGNVCTILHSCMSLPWSNGLFAGGVSISAAGAHYFRVMPKPGDRITAYVAPNMILQDGKPVLASGSPSVGLLPNIIQNTLNLLDFGLDIETSVHTPRFGGNDYEAAAFGVQRTMIEVDVPGEVRDAVVARGVNFHPVNPWNWHHGSFEGIWIDPEAGEMSACGDPRRTAQAMAV